MKDRRGRIPPICRGRIGNHIVIADWMGYFAILKRRLAAYQATGHADWRWCTLCQSWDDPKYMVEKPTGQCEHRACRNAYAKNHYHTKVIYRPLKELRCCYCHSTEGDVKAHGRRKKIAYHLECYQRNARRLYQETGWPSVRERTAVERRLGREFPTLVHLGRFYGTYVVGDCGYITHLRARARALRECGHVDWHKCKHCKEWDRPSNLVQHGPYAKKGKPGKFQVSWTHAHCHAEYSLWMQQRIRSKTRLTQRHRRFMLHEGRGRSS